MHACLQACMHTYIHTYAQTHTHTLTYRHAWPDIVTHIHASIHTLTHRVAMPASCAGCNSGIGSKSITSEPPASRELIEPTVPARLRHLCCRSRCNGRRCGGHSQIARFHGASAALVLATRNQYKLVACWWWLVAEFSETSSCGVISIAYVLVPGPPKWI